MKKHYTVKITTKAGKNYSFGWVVDESKLMRDATLEEVFLQKPYIVAKVTERNRTIVPTHAIDHVTFSLKPDID